MRHIIGTANNVDENDWGFPVSGKKDDLDRSLIRPKDEYLESTVDHSASTMDEDCQSISGEIIWSCELDTIEEAEPESLSEASSVASLTKRGTFFSTR